MGVAGRDMRLLDGRRVQVTDLVAAELLSPGTTLEYRRPRAGIVHRALVTELGRLRLEDGREFAAPSRAAKEAAGINAIDGWLVWCRPSDSRSLADLRHELLLRAAAESPDATSDLQGPAPVSARSRFEALEHAYSSASRGAPVRVTVRDFLAWWGARERGANVVDRVLADLDNHRLRTDPDFRKVGLDTTVSIAAVQIEEDGQDDSSAVSNPSSEVDDSELGLTLGNVPSALAGVTSVKDGDSLFKAMTLMRLNDYSQLPVLPGLRTLKGAVTWRSIAKALAHDRSATLNDAIEPVKTFRFDTELVEALPELFAHDFVVVTNAANEVSGIVTAADVVHLYGETATPFFIIGEIDHLLRRCIADTWTMSQVATVCDPRGERDLTSHDDLTMGDYERMLQDHDRFASLRWPLDRPTFINWLDRVRDLRNSVMHFDPDPLDPGDVDALRNFLVLLREVRERSG